MARMGPVGGEEQKPLALRRILKHQEVFRRVSRLRNPVDVCRGDCERRLGEKSYRPASAEKQGDLLKPFHGRVPPR
jgi:hypothetical protein